LRLEDEVMQTVLDDYLLAVENATERVERLTDTLEEKILASSLEPLVRGLMVLRGVAVVTASTFAAEIGDFRRFRSAKHFMSYIGLSQPKIPVASGFAVVRSRSAEIVMCVTCWSKRRSIIDADRR